MCQTGAFLMYLLAMCDGAVCVEQTENASV